MEMDKSNFCNLCFSDSVLFQLHIFQNEALKDIFHQDQFNLCYLCKSMAQHAESFVQNVQSNQLILANYQKLTESTLQTLKEQTHSPWHLTQFSLEPIEIGLGDNESCEGKFITYSSKGEKHAKNGYEIDVVVKEELINDDNAESEVVEDISDNDNDLEQYIKQEEEDEYPLKLLKQELKSEDIRIKCHRKNEKKVRVKNKQILRSCKRKEDRNCNLNLKNNLEEINIHTIHITQDECMEERLKMASDPKYLNSVYKCQNCIKGFKFKECYERHMEKHSKSNGGLICEICKQTMDSEHKLQRHKRYHSVRYKCTQCGLTRNSRLTVMDHYTAFHSQELYTYKCTQCSKAFKRQVSLRKHVAYAHQAKKQRQQCAYCEKNYGTKETLKSHMIVSHPEQVSEGKLPKRHVCGECGKAFGAASQLRIHGAKHSHDRNYYCVECDKSFKSYGTLQNHLKTTMPHADYVNFPLSCPHCDKRFAIRRSLEKHMNRIHLKIKPYQCDQCSKAYISPWSLKEHKKLTHEGYKRPLRFPCTVCDKVFDRNQILKSHLRTHTGERPYQCSKCPAQFTQASVLGTHVRLIHLRLTRDGRPKNTDR